MKKKLILGIVGVVMVASLVGCGSANQDTAADVTTPTEEVVAEVTDNEVAADETATDEAVVAETAENETENEMTLEEAARAEFGDDLDIMPAEILANLFETCEGIDRDSAFKAISGSVKRWKKMSIEYNVDKFENGGVYEKDGMYYTLTVHDNFTYGFSGSGEGNTDKIVVGEWPECDNTGEFVIKDTDKTVDLSELAKIGLNFTEGTRYEAPSNTNAMGELETPIIEFKNGKIIFDTEHSNSPDEELRSAPILYYSIKALEDNKYEINFAPVPQATLIYDANTDELINVTTVYKRVK